MKKAPLKILLVIIITGLFCLIGTLIFSKELKDFQEIHRSIMDEYVENREYMSKIEMMLYQHQALIVNHVLSDDETLDEVYAEEEKELLSETTKLITDFSYRMKGGEREKLYHKVYSDFAAYAHNSSALLLYKENGEISMAIYYNDHTLKPFLDNINENLDALDKMTKDEINDAEAKMQRANKMSELISIVVLTVIVISFIICLYFCVKITYYLDRYKIELEKELTAKNDVIRQENEKILNVQDNIIISMANLIESRDGETGEHVKRTSAYVEMIARAAKEQGIYTDILTDEYIEQLRKVAPLHDVGKISVPDNILMKPGKLTDEEFEQIKKHAPEGGRIIKECLKTLDDRSYIQMASDVASCHHEKWDGNGYAGHLAGEAIPLSARIMAIADVFDALISKRRYKEAFSLDKAFSIIEESSGSHFDPKLVKVFLSIRKQIEEYLSELNCEDTVINEPVDNTV